MFTEGQKTFGILFFIVFAIIIAYTYRKDLNMHKVMYKGSTWVFVCFILFIISLFILKDLLKYIKG